MEKQNSNPSWPAAAISRDLKNIYQLFFYFFFFLFFFVFILSLYCLVFNLALFSTTAAAAAAGKTMYKYYYERLFVLPSKIRRESRAEPLAKRGGKNNT